MVFEKGTVSGGIQEEKGVMVCLLQLDKDCIKRMGVLSHEACLAGLVRRGLRKVSKKEARLGRGFRMPVCSRYSFLRTISSFSAVSRKRAVFSRVSMVTAFPLTLVMQSTGFRSCGTHLAVPPRLCRESLMTQSSKAARFSAPEYCSLVRLSY